MSALDRKRTQQSPTQKSQVFSTADDNQPAVTIHVLKGSESRLLKTNRWASSTLLIYRQHLVAQIEVSFDLDVWYFVSLREG